MWKPLSWESRSLWLEVRETLPKSLEAFVLNLETFGLLTDAMSPVFTPDPRSEKVECDVWRDIDFEQRGGKAYILIMIVILFLCVSGNAQQMALFYIVYQSPRWRFFLMHCFLSQPTVSDPPPHWKLHPLVIRSKQCCHAVLTKSNLPKRELVWQIHKWYPGRRALCSLIWQGISTDYVVPTWLMTEESSSNE